MTNDYKIYPNMEKIIRASKYGKEDFVCIRKSIYFSMSELYLVTSLLTLTTNSVAKHSSRISKNKKRVVHISISRRKTIHAVINFL